VDSVVTSKHEGAHSGRVKGQSSKGITVLVASFTSVTNPREGYLESKAVGKWECPSGRVLRGVPSRRPLSQMADGFTIDSDDASSADF
jgi:hypothetical protein